jgi:hypothetical protein
VAEPTDRELPVPLQTPAIFVNRFQVSVSPSITRILFLESHGAGLEAPRTAFAMTTADAEELGALLIRLIRENREAQARPG